MKITRKTMKSKITLVIIITLISMFVSGCTAHPDNKTTETTGITPQDTLQTAVDKTSPTTQTTPSLFDKPKENKTVEITIDDMHSLKPVPRPTTTTITTTVAKTTTINTTKPVGKTTVTTKPVGKTTVTTKPVDKTTVTTKPVVTTPKPTTVALTEPNIPGQFNTNFENEVVRLVNIERAKEGLPALKPNESVRQSARIRAKEIVLDMSHYRPDGSPCWTAVTIPYASVGECCAGGQFSPAEVVQDWMNSSPHRRHIMGGYHEVGVGCFIAQNAIPNTYWSILLIEHFE